jgi:hypothetical protein
MSISAVGHSLLLPCVVAFFEAFPMIREVEGPPTCHTGELSPAHAIHPSSCSDSSEDIIEIENNLLAGLGFNGKRNKGVESVEGEVGICVAY